MPSGRGSPAGFGSQIQGADGAQRVFRIIAPCCLSPPFSSPCWPRWAGSGRSCSSGACPPPSPRPPPFPRRCASACPGTACAAGWPAWAPPSRAGTGWPAATARGILLTDTDLFPPGRGGPQRHQDLWGLPGGEGGGRHRHPHPGLGQRPGQDLPRPAPLPGRRLPPLLRLRAVRGRAGRRHPGGADAGGLRGLHAPDGGGPAPGPQREERGVLRHRRGAGRASSP